MSIRCRLGWHDRGVVSHHLGQPWVFNMHCRRCGKCWTDEYWLPPQPIICEHGPECHFDLRPPMTVVTPDGPEQLRWLSCRICDGRQRFERRYGIFATQ